MCGLTGLYNTNLSRPKSKELGIARGMTDAIKSRGPDAGDVWQDKQSSLILGHRRLSILDLSDSGAQPMHSASGRYVIAYNGEIYNMLALKAQLTTTFRGSSDTEVILAAIEEWGLNTALQKLNGMFAFALWDRERKMLHFARDRMGKKPLYIGWAGDSLVFASELKAIRAHLDFKAVLNETALELFMRYAAIPAPHSIYQNIWMLPPASRLSLKVSELKPGTDLTAQMESYWRPEPSIPFEGTQTEAIDALEACLKTCTKDRMLSDVPLGAFLSGGIDSSAVVAMMQAHSDQTVKTYSIGFTESGFDEAVYARKVANHLGTDHHELYVSQQDALDVIPSLPDMYDEPFADISAIPTALVSQFARNDVTVALSGDGGDEMLGGYNRHISAPPLWNKLRFVPRSIASAITGISTESWNKLLPFKPQAGTAMHKLAALIGQKSRESAYEALITHWPEYSAAINHAAVSGLPFAEQMMLWDLQHYLPSTILTKVDRASMAHSLEVRAPLLDKRIYELASSMPLNYKIRNGQGKWLLREVLKRHVPPDLFERPKQGFSMPVGEWLRSDLRTWGEDLLTHDMPVLNMQDIRATWQAHQNGQGDHAKKLWTALMALAWHKRWMD